MLDVAPHIEMLQACRSGDSNRVGQLIAWGVDPNLRVNGARAFLSEACMAGHLQVVKVLLRHGVIPTPRDLVYAVESGDVYLADRIADELFYADTEYDFWFGDRPLMCKPGFLQSTSARMVEWMLGQGADLTEADPYGRRPVDLAVLDGVDAEVRQILEERTPPAEPV